MDAAGVPLLVGGLSGLAVLFFWLALAPARAPRAVDRRLGSFVAREDLIETRELARPLVSRTLIPLLHRLLHFLGGLLPQRNLEKVAQQLVYAGEPGGLSALDFVGLRILLAVGLAAGYFFVLGSALPPTIALRNAMVGAMVGSLLPRFWLRRRVRGRQNNIRRTLPDALDMLTVGVEAGLAFESALLRVGEQWRNPLTREFRRAVAEMRIGAGRNEALERIVARTGVEELGTFIAILVQSNQLGVSIAQVLTTQAEQMRIKRRQRAEQQAQQAPVKMIFPLVLCIFPTLFIVILGPAAITVYETLIKE